MKKRTALVAPTAAQIARQERIFETEGAIRWKGGPIICRAVIGDDALKGLVRSLRSANSTTSVDLKTSSRVNLQAIFRAFTEENYVLWYDTVGRKGGSATLYIILKDAITPAGQLKAWAHGLHLMKTWESLALDELPEAAKYRSTDDMRALVLENIITTLTEINNVWDEIEKGLRSQGWDVACASLETGNAVRVKERSD